MNSIRLATTITASNYESFIKSHPHINLSFYKYNFQNMMMMDDSILVIIILN